MYRGGHMNKEDLLELGLEESTANKVIKLHATTNNNLRKKLEDKDNEISSLKESVKQTKEELAEVSELQETISKLEKQNEELLSTVETKDAELGIVTKKSSVRDALVDAGVLNIDAALKLVDIEAVTLTKEGTIDTESVQKVVEGAKETVPQLFPSDVTPQGGYSPKKGTEPVDHKSGESNEPKSLFDSIAAGIESQLNISNQNNNTNTFG